MKKLLLFCGSILLLSCVPRQEEIATEYEPILIDRISLENSIQALPPKTMNNPGKIYYKEPFLFINEKFEGIHVFNNSNPSNPENIGFIQIPGNIDIAIKGDVIYADNSVDLVALRYDGNNATVLDRNKDVFPELVPPDFGWVPNEYLAENRPANTVIVKWIRK